jgi:uncharacterized protein (DUF488 family)
MFDSQPTDVRTRLLTIGYEGAQIDDFIKTLKSANVRSLVDVRELPLSRKKGFSKRALREVLEANGINYIHVKQLGDPKPGRDAARAGNLSEFNRIFRTHICKSESLDAMHELLPVIAEGGACLLCFERHIVAEALGGLVDLNIAHIGVRHSFAI